MFILDKRWIKVFSRLKLPESSGWIWSWEIVMHCVVTLLFFRCTSRFRDIQREMISLLAFIQSIMFRNNSIALSPVNSFALKARWRSVEGIRRQILLLDSPQRGWAMRLMRSIRTADYTLDRSREGVGCACSIRGVLLLAGLKLTVIHIPRYIQLPGPALSPTTLS